MIVLLLACTSGEITVSGIEDFGPVRSATALDVTIDELWVVGAGSLGEYRATSVLLSDEPLYCDIERSWYEDTEQDWEAMAQGREASDQLCDEGAAAINLQTVGYPHAVPRHTAALAICVDGLCSWDDVVPGTYDLYNPADPYVAGTITYTTGTLTPAAGDFDEDACHSTADFDDRRDDTYTLYDLDDGSLTLDTVAVGSSVKGSFDAIIYEQSGELGTVRGDFTTDWCEIHVSTMVLL